MKIQAKLLTVVLALSVSALVGCSGDADSSPSDLNNACEHANDGVCDEPSNCTLGTDQTDCKAACESGENMAMIRTACAKRGLAPAPEPETYEEPAPSGGDEHLTGWRDVKIEVKSGLEDRDTVMRHFKVYVPPSYDPDKAYPVMINMPGHRVSHHVLPGSTMLHRTANHNDFIAIFAAQEFREARWAFWTEWYGSAMDNPLEVCRQKTTENPDFDFLKKIIDWSEEKYNVDSRRIYLSGHSRGAATAFIAAIEMPDLIAGASIHSGFTECGWLNEKLENWDGREVPLVFVHGAEDDDICIDCEPGGTCGVNPSRSCAPGMHASDAIVERLEELGWDENLKYYRLEHVAHRWQTQLNQEIWDYLAERPLPKQ